MRRQVNDRRQDLLACATELNINIDQLMEIRASFAEIMFDNNLDELKMGTLMAHIISVISLENLLKKMEEHGPDD
jgi:hypothetical protein